MDTLKQPRIAGDGHPEQAWRCSRWLSSLPVQPMASLLEGMRRLVVVSPHPDDEVLGCGGLIHHAHRAGVPVRLLAVTLGEACYPGHARWTRERLRDMRADELVRALAALGVATTAMQSLGFPDGGVASRERQLAEALHAQFRPGDHVFCTATWDGHPDHEAAGRATRIAAGRAGARASAFPIWAWHWTDPCCAVPPAPGAARYALDEVSWRAKQCAMACFTSQRVGPGDCPPILPPHVIARFARQEETFFHGLA